MNTNTPIVFIPRSNRFEATKYSLNPWLIPSIHQSSLPLPRIPVQSLSAKISKEFCWAVVKKIRFEKADSQIQKPNKLKLDTSQN